MYVPPEVYPHVTFISRRDMINHASNYADRILDQDVAIISISDTPDEWARMDEILKPFNCFTVMFADTNDDKSISENQANEILAFINANRDKKFLVHCWAGISRSAAIARFINEHLNLGSIEFDGYMMYNRWVYNALKAAAGESLAAYYENLEIQDRLNPTE